MPPLIRVSPSAASWNLNQEQSSKLLANLQSDPDVSNKKLGVTIGSFTAQGVDFSYVYTVSNELLVLTIVAVHSFKAKVAGHDAIFSAVNDMIDAALV